MDNGAQKANSLIAVYTHIICRRAATLCCAIQPILYSYHLSPPPPAMSSFPLIQLFIENPIISAQWTETVILYSKARLFFQFLPNLSLKHACDELRHHFLIKVGAKKNIIEFSVIRCNDFLFLTFPLHHLFSLILSSYIICLLVFLTFAFLKFFSPFSATYFPVFCFPLHHLPH